MHLSVVKSLGSFRIKFNTYCTLPIERDVQGHKKRLCPYNAIVCFGGHSSEILGYSVRVPANCASSGSDILIKL